MTIQTDTLESLCELIVDCSHSTPMWTDKGFIVLRNQNIKNGRLDLTDPSFTDEEHFEQRVRRAEPQAGDIVLTREAPMGEVCMIPEGVKCCLGQRQVLLRPKKEVNGKYLLFALQSPAVQHEISWNEGTGSTVSNVRIPVLKKLNIPRHPGNEDTIAEILSSLSDKIELNRQTNQTLEQIAQAIFKSWFVDFDPVRAKIAAREAFIQQHPEVTAEAIRAAAGTEGDTLAHAGAKACELAAVCVISGKSEEQLNDLSAEALQQLKVTAALFPDTLVDAKDGELPEGWVYKALDEIAHYQNGLALQKFRPKDGEESLPVVKIAQLSKGFADGEERASSSIRPECIIENGDVVFSWSGSLMVDVWCGGKAALNQHLFKVTSEKHPKWFYYLYTKHHLSKFKQIAADKAVTMGHIKRGHLSEAMCAVPKSGVDDLVLMTELLNKQVELRLECVLLQEMRDVILPKLLSGELQMDEVA